MSKGLEALDNKKARIKMAVMDLGSDLSMFINTHPNLHYEEITAYKEFYKDKITAIHNAIDELFETALKDRIYLQKQVDNLTYVNNQKDKIIKAFEIIKEKNVDVQLIKNSKNFHDYNYCVQTKVRALTQEEYDLLKEWLK